MKTVAQTTSEKAAEAISHQITTYLGAEIEPGFRVIRYPPGYNFNVTYSMPVMDNPHTFALIDQLCKVTGPYSASMTGSSFSTEFAGILGSVGYHTSKADQIALNKATRQFTRQGETVITTFETDFGTITPAMIKASGAIPQTKSGYIVDYVAKHYPGKPPHFPVTLAAFGAAYSKWMLLGEAVEKPAKQERAAMARVNSAKGHATRPSTSNGGAQTGPSTWAVAYSGLPTNNQINTRLDNTSSTVTVTVDVQSTGSGSASLSVDNQHLGEIPESDLTLRLLSGTSLAARQVDLWASAQQVTMKIVYTGITPVRANPVELAADRKTGWFSRQILQDIIAKTGEDVTGLQLQGSTYSVKALFGPGKSFARVQTFVISKEPKVSMTFHGAATKVLTAQIAKDQVAELALGDIVSFGVSGADYKVLDVAPATNAVTVSLGAVPQSGSVPLVDQTTHIIGGVVQFPP